MTLAAARCVPRRGRSRPRSARAADPFTLDVATRLASPPPGGFVQAAVDAYARTGCRPPWLSDELLELLERQGRLVGVVYLLHFDRPVGDVTNPRGFAGHYSGWTLNLPARLQDHAAGRGARLMEVVGEAGIGWPLARIWPGTRTRERSLKRSGGAARRCPVCQLASFDRQPPRPVNPLPWSWASARPRSSPPPHRPSCRRRWPHDPSDRPRGGEPPMPASGTWLTASQAARRLHVSAKTVARWATEGRLAHRRTLGGHRRFDPELIDALVNALTYRP